MGGNAQMCIIHMLKANKQKYFPYKPDAFPLQNNIKEHSGSF